MPSLKSRTCSLDNKVRVGYHNPNALTWQCHSRQNKMKITTFYKSSTNEPTIPKFPEVNYDISGYISTNFDHRLTTIQTIE